jgi:hypothetical protein
VLIGKSLCLPAVTRRKIDAGRLAAVLDSDPFVGSAGR